jgi:hypothetical protein
MSAELFLPILPPEVLHIRIELEVPNGQEKVVADQQKDEVFDTVAAWCDEEQLFIGGSLVNAVVYAPMKSISPQQIKQLRKLIRSQPGVTGCQMKLKLLSYLQSSPEKAACLEAFCQAQRHLAEKLADTADALARLVPAGPTSWRASVTQSGAMLLLLHVSLQISITLVRQDADRREGAVPEFERFNKKIVALSDLQSFIPDWLDLHWSKVTQHPETDLSIGRWQAQGQGWQIWVTGAPVAQLTHREVMLRWLGAIGAV